MTLTNILKIYLIFGGIYLILNGLIHLFDLRLLDVTLIWPKSALTYARLLNHIYASFIILAGLLCILLQSDMKKYQNLIYTGALWAVFHGSLLIFTAFTINFQKEFKGFNSLLVWLPFYNQNLIFEAALLILFSLIVVFWWRSDRKA